MKLQTNIAKTSLLTAAIFAAGAFVALAQSQQAHAQTQRFQIGTGTGATEVTASPGNTTSYDVYFNETDSSDADANASTVVSVQIHYDSAVFSSPVVTNLAAVADVDPAACQVSGSQPTDVAAAADNLKISGFSAGDEDETGSITVGTATAIATDKIVSVTFAQICGPVFANTGLKQLFTVTFDVDENFGGTGPASTVIGFAAANGGDFEVSAIEDINASVIPQTFTLDVDGARGFGAGDGVMIVRYANGVRGAFLTAGQSAADPVDVAATIAEGAAGALDVDSARGFGAGDGVMIVRYANGVRGAFLTAGQSATDPADVVTAISALAP